MTLTLFPAMDLYGGRVVRLRQGRAADVTVYSEHPAEVARRWQAQGASWLHVVDLDRALGQKDSPNGAALAEILQAVSIPVQLGGGLRDQATIEQALAQGVHRVVVGTLAVEQPDEFARLVEQIDADKIIVAADVRGSRVATRGWQELSNLDLIPFGQRLRALGIRCALVTDIARDGMLTGVDAPALARVARETGLGVIASGGVASLDDLRALAQHAAEGIQGAVVGQALYTGAIKLTDALQAVRDQ